jgi:hypothetical protein
MAVGKGRGGLIPLLLACAAVCAVMLPRIAAAADSEGLWPVYEQALKGAKYVDLTHTIAPNIPV